MNRVLPILPTILVLTAAGTIAANQTPFAHAPYRSDAPSPTVALSVTSCAAANPTGSARLLSRPSQSPVSAAAAGTGQVFEASGEQGTPAAEDTSDVGSPRVVSAPVTHVDLVRASQMEDLSERIRVLEGFLTRRATMEQRRLLFRMLVSTCRQSGDFEGAIFYGEEALRAYPSDGPILLELTAAHAEMEDSNLDEGIRYAQRAMDALDAAAEAMGEGGEARLSVFAGSCLCDWGWMLFRQGETEEAGRLLERAVAKKKDPLVYRRLGRVRASAGQLDEAKDAYALALAMSSGKDSTAMGALKEIVALQGGGETDVETVVNEKRKEVREHKMQVMRERTKIEPKAAPAFTVTILSGETVSLRDLRGSVVLLDFWATWCAPCRKELPVIQKVFEEFRDQKVFVIAASVDSDTSRVRPFVKTNRITLPVAFAKSTGKEYGASSIPTLFLIDGEGTIRFVHSGYHPDLEEMLPLQIEELLNEL